MPFYEVADLYAQNIAQPGDTQPNTPQPELVFDGLFAKLIPINSRARLALDITKQKNPVDYHRQFIGTTDFEGEKTNCFELSLNQLPQFAGIGWRIGRGRKALENRGVDLLLLVEGTDDVAGIHARFNWVKGAGGFFIIADNKRGKKIMMNGEFFSNDLRTIPYQNAITIGECLFTLQYVDRSPEEDEQFQVELKAFFHRFHNDENPIVLPTPSEHNATFGEWDVNYPISRGTFGTVYMVTHRKDGRPAAAKQILMSEQNKVSVEREIKMARRISNLEHNRIASPFYIYHRKSRTKVETARIRTLLDDSWNPTLHNIRDEYIIFSSLLSATFRSLICSKVSQGDRSIFYLQLLEAVDFIHSEGICHRDIKPDNILVKSYDPPDVMLTDFGCASEEESILYDSPGTIAYLAPEQVQGKTHGRPVDYWACGLVGMALIQKSTTARRVMPGERLAQVQKFLEGSISPIAICCRPMLEEDPDSRMTAAQGIAQLRGMPSLKICQANTVKTGSKRRSTNPAQSISRRHPPDLSSYETVPE